jgi:hypothetical protein
MRASAPVRLLTLAVCQVFRPISETLAARTLHLLHDLSRPYLRIVQPSSGAPSPIVMSTAFLPKCSRVHRLCRVTPTTSAYLWLLQTDLASLRGHPFLLTSHNGMMFPCCLQHYPVRSCHASLSASSQHDSCLLATLDISVLYPQSALTSTLEQGSP